MNKRQRNYKKMSVLSRAVPTHRSLDVGVLCCNVVSLTGTNRRFRETCVSNPNSENGASPNGVKIQTNAVTFTAMTVRTLNVAEEQRLHRKGNETFT